MTGGEFALQAAELLLLATDGKNCVAQGFTPDIVPADAHGVNKDEPNLAVVTGYVRGVRYFISAERPETPEGEQAAYGEILAACKYLNERVTGGSQ